MFTNKEVLERKPKPSPIGETSKSMQGALWAKEEEQRLIEEFKEGLSLEEIAEKHGRTSGGIRSRLRKLELIE